MKVSVRAYMLLIGDVAAVLTIGMVMLSRFFGK
jgi:hypothetical protein